MPGEVAYVSAQPNCDFCDSDVPAVFDGKTRMGPWAFMCERHRDALGVQGVGTGIAQKLVHKDVAEGNDN